MTFTLGSKTHMVKLHLIDGFNIGGEYGDGWLQFNFGIFRLTFWWDIYTEE